MPARSCCIRDRLNQILANHTGQPIEKIADDTDRDHFMGGEEAVAYGLIDTVLTKRGHGAGAGLSRSAISRARA